MSRRTVLAGAAASVLSVGSGKAADLTVLKIGLLPFGTVQWAIQALKANGFDTAQGLRIEIVPLATTEAARVAFLSGSVDTIVQDILFAARLKAEGKPVVFLPQSSTEGELVVAAASPIRDLADLKGKKIGVAGGAIDKNWLFLRAAALKLAQLDLVRDASPVYGAPPLLAAKLESGELDCGLLYWSQAARLQAKGYRRVSSTESVLKSLGAKGQVAVGGYLFPGNMARETLLGFRNAVRAADNLLADNPESWTDIRPLMKAPDDATFEALKSAYLRGIPRKPRDKEIADAREFVALVGRVGGAALLGPVKELPEDLYVGKDIYGGVDSETKIRKR